MVTFKPIVVFANQRRDGTWVVYIRVTQHGVVRRLPTNLICRAADLTRSGRIKSADVLRKAGELCDRMRDTLSHVPPSLVDNWDADEVVRHINRRLAGEDFRLDFFAFGEEYAATKTKQTGRSYIQALNALERYLGERRLDINAITRAMLLSFVQYLDNEPRMTRKGAKSGAFPTKLSKTPGGASSRSIAKMKHIYEAAKAKYNDEDTGCIRIPRSPFSGISTRQPPSHGQKALPVEVIRRILEAETPHTMERVALDAFALSFLLMGSNLADLYRARAFDGMTWVYNRKKTETRRADRAEMRCEIPPEALPFIESLRSRGPKGWWLPALHLLGGSGDSCSSLVNRALHDWSDREGLPRFTFYAARHSWATIARRLGVEKATVDECLCHVGDYVTTDIYAERAWHLMTAANQKVIDYVTSK